MTKQHIYDLVKKINTFPSLPAVATKVLEISNDPESSIYDLINVITLDQAFSVSVLKIANSAFYGRVRGVGSLKEAISVLGIKEIRNIVISKAMFNRFKHEDKNKVFDINDFWKHSLYCSLFAKIIANESGYDECDFFMAGLIHDIGKLIIYFELQDEFIKTYEASNFNLSKMYDLEIKTIGTTHDKVGSMLVKKWMFPETLVDSVRYHHNPLETEKDPFLPLVIHLADILAYHTDDQDEEIIMNKITSEKIEVFRSNNITLDLKEIKKYLEKFDVKKEEVSDMLNLLLS